MKNENENKKKFIESLFSVTIFQIFIVGATQAVVSFFTGELLRKIWNKNRNKNEE